jgi:hypothetical protein
LTVRKLIQWLEQIRAVQRAEHHIRFWLWLWLNMGGQAAVLERRCSGRPVVWIPAPQALPSNFVHQPLPHPIMRVFYACGYIGIVTTSLVLLSPIFIPVGSAVHTTQLLKKLVAREESQRALSLVPLSAQFAAKLFKTAIKITLRLGVKAFGVLFFLFLLCIELISELLPPLDSTSSSSSSASTSTTPGPSRMPL